MDSEVLFLPAPKEPKGGKDWRDEVTQIAFEALCSSQDYKQARMDQLAWYERLYLNDVPRKFRQLSNVVVPVFSGLVDTLLADFNDEMQIKFSGKISDYLIVPKVQKMWEKERDNLKPNARWNQKGRWDRFNAVLSGRGIFQFYTESDPEYRSVLEVINYSDFHCQSLGGGNIDNHLFKGREGIYRTLEEVTTNDSYDEEQRKKLKDFTFSSEFMQVIQDTYGTKLQRFYSLGLNPDGNSYTGDKTLNLCRFQVTYKGSLYAVLFEPLSKTWLDVRPWSEELFASWATHEDHKNFWNKSYADDFAKIAETINILFNQEITNREKRNNAARAFDPLMYKDPQKLDEAQYIPDRLVPFDSGGGVRRADSGIYTFETAELKGTIDLSGTLMKILGDYTGANELSLGGGSANKKPTVVIAQQQQLSKRIGLRTDPMKECYAQLGRMWFNGLKKDMPVKTAIEILGEDGFVEEQELSRDEVEQVGELSITVVSNSEQENLDVIRRDSKAKAIETVSSNPTMSKFEKEVIYREVGQFDENQIAFLVDDLPYSARKQIAHASKALQALLLNKTPSVYYNADTSYLQYIQDWVVDQQDKLMKGNKYKRFTDFIKQMGPIVQENMARKARTDVRAQKAAAAAQGQGQDPNAAAGGAAGGVASPFAPAQKMGQSM